MPSLNTLRTVTIRQVSEGADKVRSDLDGLAAAQQRVAQASDATATVTEMSSRRQLSAAAAYDKVRATVDANFRSQQQLERSTRTLDRALQQGVIGAEAYERTLGQLQARYGAVGAAATASIRSQRDGWRELGDQGRVALQNLEASRKLGSLGGTAGPAANQNDRLRSDQVQNLVYQGGDILSSLGSGSNLTTVVLQQGPQIAQVFGGAGGASVKGALAQAGEAASGLAVRVGIVGGTIAGVTTLALAGVAAWNSYDTSQKAVRQSLAGIGQASGATVGQINALAPAAAAAGNVSTRSARQMASEYAATGKIGTEMYVGLIGSAKDYAATTGQDISDANKALAQAFADPAKGADALNEQLGFLNDTTRENIQRLAAQGDRLGAQKLLLDAYKTGLSSATELTSTWERTTAAVGDVIANVWDTVGGAIDRVVTGGDLETRLATAQKVLANSQARQGYLPFGIGQGDTTAAQAEVTRLQGEIAKLRQQREQRQQKQTSTRIGDIVKELSPAAEQMKKIADQAQDIRKNLTRLPLDEQGAARAAMEGLVAQSRQLRENMQAGGAEYAASLRAAGFQQRTAGFSPTAQTAASIENDIAERTRTAQASGTREEQLARLQTLELERVTRLQTLESQTYRDTSTGSGRYSMGVGQAPAQYRGLIYDAANASGVNADLLTAQIRRESSFNPNAVSSAGAQGISQFTPPTAHGMGLQNPFDPAQAIPKQAELMAQLLRQFNGNEVAALIGYNAGPRTAQRFLAGGSDVSTLPRETQDYIKAILTPPPGAEQMIRDEAARRQEIQRANDNLRTNTQLYGQNGLRLEAATEANRRLAEEQGKGVAITDSYRQSIVQTATATATAAQQLKLVQFSRDVAFDREQLGRTAPEAAAYARARSLVGDTSTPEAQKVITESRATNELVDAKNMASSALSGFSQDLRNGATAAQAASNALGRLADSVLNKVIDSVVSSAFGAASKGGIGSLFGFATGGVMTSNGPLPLHSYATGGIASSPQLALFGEGRGPEAFVPLPDGKRIPVAMSGPANANGRSSAPAIRMGDISISAPGADKEELLRLRAYVDRSMAESRRTIGQQFAEWKLSA